MTEEIKDETYFRLKEEYLSELKRLEQENKELKEYSQRMENQRENYYKEYNNYRSALEKIREIEKLAYYPKGMPEKLLTQWDFILHAIDDYEQRRIKILTKINEVLNESN